MTLLSQIRIISGLTFDQMALLFGVSKQEILRWVSGAPIEEPHFQICEELATFFRWVDRGSSKENQSLLFANEMSIWRLLLDKRYVEAKESIEQGKGRKQVPVFELSTEQKNLRRPLPPEDLVDAIQTPIPHQNMARPRAVKVKRGLA